MGAPFSIPDRQASLQRGSEDRHSEWHAGALAVARADYEALLARLPDATLFNDWDWLAASAAHLDAARRVLTLALRERGRLVACLPLTWGWERVGGVPVRTLRLLGYPLADRVALPVEPGQVERLLRGLIECPRPWDVLVFDELCEPVALRPSLERWCVGNALIGRWVHTSHCPWASLDPNRPVEAASKSVRRNLSRFRRKLEATGTLTLRHAVPRPAEIPALLERLAGLEARSWKGARGLGLFSTPARLAFFTDLSTRLAARGMVQISEVVLDERPVAQSYGFRFGGAYLYYSPAYLPELAPFGVGRVLLDDLLNRACIDGLSRFDASRTSLRTRCPLEDYPVSYVDHVRFQAFAPTTPGRLAYLVEHGLKPPLKALRRKWKGRARPQRRDRPD